MKDIESMGTTTADGHPTFQTHLFRVIARDLDRSLQDADRQSFLADLRGSQTLLRDAITDDADKQRQPYSVRYGTPGQMSVVVNDAVNVVDTIYALLADAFADEQPTAEAVEL